MKMKKIAALMLTVVLGSSMLLTGCGAKDNAGTAEGESTATVTEDGKIDSVYQRLHRRRRRIHEKNHRRLQPVSGQIRNR